MQVNLRNDAELNPYSYDVRFVNPALEDFMSVGQQDETPPQLKMFCHCFDSDNESSEMLITEKHDSEHLIELDDPFIPDWREKATESTNSFTSVSVGGKSTVIEQSDTPAATSPKAAMCEEIGSESKDNTHIDEQLNFIFNSIKRNKCLDDLEIAGAKPQRTRKSKFQVEILQRELGNCKNATGKMIKDAAKKAGLKKLQAYKWYWDKQKRHRQQSAENSINS